VQHSKKIRINSTILEMFQIKILKKLLDNLKRNSSQTFIVQVKKGTI